MTDLGNIPVTITRVGHAVYIDSPITDDRTYSPKISEMYTETRD